MNLPPLDEGAWLLSGIAPIIGFDARKSFRSAERLPCKGPIDESGCREGKPDYDGIAEAQAAYRRALSSDRLGQLARHLGVGEKFLREFDLGWCEDLGSVTIATVDDSTCTAGVELIPLSWPSGLIPDQGPLHGLGGLVAVPRTVRPDADLVVSGDWLTLDAEWAKGNNVAFQRDLADGLGVARAVVARWGFIGSQEPLVRLPSNVAHPNASPAERAAAAMRQWAWDKAIAEAQRIGL